MVVGVGAWDDPTRAIGLEKAENRTHDELGQQRTR